MAIDRKFTFVCLTYNHAIYIAEHLESIKYLIQRHGENFQFTLIIADDGSKDQTVEIVKRWTHANQSLFEAILIEADGINRGTCFNFTKVWQYIGHPNFKVLAGDDVYSCENIFENLEILKTFDFFTGFPIFLKNDKIFWDKANTFNMVASDVIYRDRPFMDRHSLISVINTPSLFYRHKFFLDQDIFDFVRSFKVVEDFPFVVKIAEKNRFVRFLQLDKIFIYYRRTENSTYLIKANQFDYDRISIFRRIAELEKSCWRRFLVENRIFCYFIRSLALKRILNISYYLYAFNIVLNLFEILRNYSRLKPNINKYADHYLEIKRSASDFLEANGVNPSKSAHSSSSFV